jgi:hypothetical protein
MMAAPTATLLCIILVTCSGQITVLKRLKEFNGNDSFVGTGHDSMPKSKEDILSHNTCMYVGMWKPCTAKLNSDMPHFVVGFSSVPIYYISSTEILLLSLLDLICPNICSKHIPRILTEMFLQ